MKELTFILQSSSPHKSLVGYKDYEGVLEKSKRTELSAGYVMKAFRINVRGQLKMKVTICEF